MKGLCTKPFPSIEECSCIVQYMKVRWRKLQIFRDKFDEGVGLDRHPRGVHMGFAGLAFDQPWSRSASRSARREPCLVLSRLDAMNSITSRRVCGGTVVLSFRNIFVCNYRLDKFVREPSRIPPTQLGWSAELCICRKRFGSEDAIAVRSSSCSRRIASISIDVSCTILCISRAKVESSMRCASFSFNRSNRA
ncbi:uncharacterized protein K489DRAFT_176149 [Dissoconium aciculare CBS 342.82]|uniref:Uncharacterized protein n=1 Tax=Dissoconium aciculare CBS 342.82 TaxID=1314786 RepID=A0A6J3M861_9PEZI|nr:uncharacterized protein K489DRAFT_176149 [Dissoconium aciculare CBS 342.82]KAF1824180.1 hypothetical protein K489DRAFT_176149 [Dissoconium aciculare CBS 342.82]